MRELDYQRSKSGKMRYCFGIDIGGTTVKIGLFSINGEIIDKWEIKTHTENQGEKILPDISESILNKLKEKKILKSDVNGIGIGVPAPVKADGIVKNTVNLGWKYKEVKREMEELSGLRTEVGNDANVAALGEMWLGAGKGQENMIMVTLGTGVGGGIIVDGKIVAGYNGAGGEIGHITVNNDEIEPCNCGQYGCLEQYTSATGIVRMAKRKLAKTQDETSLRKFENITAKDIFDEAKAGDAVALLLVNEVGEILGSTLSNIACVVNPEVIVIGGGVSKAGQILIDTIKKHYQETSFKACRDTRFELASLGNDAGIYGSMNLVINN